MHAIPCALPSNLCAIVDFRVRSMCVNCIILDSLSSMKQTGWWNKAISRSFLQFWILFIEQGMWWPWNHPCHKKENHKGVMTMRTGLDSKLALTTGLCLGLELHVHLFEVDSCTNLRIQNDIWFLYVPVLRMAPTNSKISFPRFMIMQKMLILTSGGNRAFSKDNSWIIFVNSLKLQSNEWRSSQIEAYLSLKNAWLAPIFFFWIPRVLSKICFLQIV